MPVKERRQRERDHTRTRIMDAARRMFASEGYEAVSMRRIAEAIEYSPTAIYVHFKDKDDLFRSICDEDFLALADSFREVAVITDPVEAIGCCGLVYARFGLEHPNHYRLMFMSGKPAAPSEKHLLRRGNIEEDAYAFLRELCSRAVGAKRLRSEFSDPELAAQTFWAGVHGVVSLQISKSEDAWIDWKPVEQRVESMVQTLLRGICIEPPHGRAKRGAK